MFYCIFIRFQQELNVILKYLGPQKVIKNWKKMSIADQYMLMIDLLLLLTKPQCNKRVDIRTTKTPARLVVLWSPPSKLRKSSSKKSFKFAFIFNLIVPFYLCSLKHFYRSLSLKSEPDDRLGKRFEELSILLLSKLTDIMIHGM